MENRLQNKPFEVIVLGAAAVDLLVSVEAFPPVDGIVYAGCSTAYPGGSGANIAVGLARLGRRVSFYGKVGDDEYGRLLEQSFLEAGVNLDRFYRVAGEKSATCFIPIDAQGNRMIFSMGGTALIDEVAELDLQILEQTPALIISDTWIEVGAAAAKAVRRGGGTVFFCPGGLMASCGLKSLAPILQSTQVLILSRNELATLTQKEQVDEALSILASCGPKVIIITLGKDGAVIACGEEQKMIKAWVAPEVVDSTGAGDAFSAGLISGYLEGLSWSEAASLGCAVAAIKVSHIGSRGGLPNPEEVRDFMKRSG